ncbi:MAG: tetratricopeptide repeat protein, partial [Candidatus Cloacimonetes bacterium]|nr:tetratricopeptide repeat protein [Candidatus Cloacimonadota bacterium]
MPIYKVLVAILVLGTLFAHIAYAQTIKPSNLERYAYQYIVELYERGAGERLSREINSFQARYPQSYYNKHLRFLGANLALEQGLHDEALRIYNELLTEDLELSLRHNIYLYRAMTLIVQEDYSAAMHQIQILESETKDTVLLARANLYRARLYRRLGQYYSAMLSYQYTLKEAPEPEIEYEYFEVLVKLQKEEEAKEVLYGINEQSHIYTKSNVVWAKYLLDNNRFQEFDEHMARIPTILNDPQIQLLRIHKAIAVDNFGEAAELLSKSDARGSHFDYLRALVLVKAGETQAADSIFATLVKQSEPEIKVLSYLERLKILFQKEPMAAMLQLGSFIDQPQNDLMKAEQLFTMGYFAYMKQDYPEALRYMAQARRESNKRLLLADIDLYIAQAWLKVKDNSQALASFNRYLNLYPTGKDRDAALYYLGFLYHESKDYRMATSAFQQLIESHPRSAYLPSAKFYLAEMDFYMANYNLALDAFLEIVKAEPENSDAILRVAQIYYYSGEYDHAETWVSKLKPIYDSLILEGHIHFSRKDYQTALQKFQTAENSTEDKLRKSEAKSYRALCLYQLKQYTEASRLYMELFEGQESPDTYLYLGAKSAYAAGDYNLALELFDHFLQTYPDSQYYLPVLADVANSYFNLGNYHQATTDYMNILRRFRNIQDFNDADQALLREVFTGLDFSLSRIDDPAPSMELMEMADSFHSEYIRFELSYLLTKLYAGRDMWNDVLEQAQNLRSEFPDYKRNDVEMLMAQSLINLNEYQQADSLLSNLYSDTQDMQALISWAEVDILTGNYDDAINKFHDALQQEPSPELWYKALSASVAAGFIDFEQLWDLGAEYETQVHASSILKLDYLMHSQHYDEADLLAEDIINNSPSTHDHATAFLNKALIL